MHKHDNGSAYAESKNLSRLLRLYAPVDLTKRLEDGLDLSQVDDLKESKTQFTSAIIIHTSSSSSS